MKMFFSVDKKKKQYMKKWIYSLSEYQSKKQPAIFLYMLSIFFIIFHASIPIIAYVLGECNAAAIGAGIGVGVAIATIPFAFARSISAKVKKNCGSPYTKREQECLIVYEDGIEFVFHNTDSRYIESRDVYRIPIENINAVRYDANYHIITIIGQGEFLSYDDYPSRRLNHQNSQRRFYNNSPYYILNAFDKEDDVIMLLGGMAKNKSAI